MQTAGTTAKWQSTANLHTMWLVRGGHIRTQPWVKPIRVLSSNSFRAFGCLIVVGNIIEYPNFSRLKPHFSPQVLAWHGSGSRSYSNSCSNWNKVCSVRSLFSLLWPWWWSWILLQYSIVALSKEVGKQSSELRMTFTQWGFTLHNNTFMKGGGRLYITWPYIHDGWCELVHHKTIHSWRVVWNFTPHNNTFTKGAVTLYIAEQYIHEGWNFTLYFTPHGCRSHWNSCMIVLICFHLVLPRA